MKKKIKGKKLDLTQNEIRYRLKSPAKFDMNSFRRKKIREGVALLIACPKGKYLRKKCKVGTQAQAVRFSREFFTPSQATKWIERHDL